MSGGKLPPGMEDESNATSSQTSMATQPMAAPTRVPASPSDDDLPPTPCDSRIALTPPAHAEDSTPGSPVFSHAPARASRAGSQDDVLESFDTLVGPVLAAKEVGVDGPRHVMVEPRLLPPDCALRR